MTSAMPYRGPDGIHHWVKGSVALGQCMLCTTEESLGEHQPLANEDESLVLVLDGWLSNWVELREELLKHGVKLRDRSDAELVLRSFETWGTDCLAHLDGDFALVIWDAQRREAFCARDRIGHKPFNYHWDGQTFTFASELHPILALPWVPEELNEGMVAEWLAAEWYSRDETFWHGVLRLVAAHRMEVGPGGLQVQQYWTPDLWATQPYARDEDYIGHYRELFTDVVRRQSRSNLPVACEVSGGLDSSAIFAVAEHLRLQNQFLAPALDGYTLDFKGDPAADELDYARAVGLHLNRCIQEIKPSKMPLTWYQDRAQTYREFPGYPNGVMGLGIKGEARSRGSRVLFCGAGGDEWMNGSASYYAEAIRSLRVMDFLKCFRADCRDLGVGPASLLVMRSGLGQFLPERVKQLIRKLIYSTKVEKFDRRSWLTPRLQEMLKTRSELWPALPEGQCRRPGQRTQLARLWGAYSIQAHEMEERFSANLGLELRRPFWDTRVVQFSLNTPEQCRFLGGVNKLMHRKAMAGLLPDLVLQRETKGEFSITIHQHLPEMGELLLRKIPARRDGWVEPRWVGTLYQCYSEEKYSGWAEQMLWVLFGSDAIG